MVAVRSHESMIGVRRCADDSVFTQLRQHVASDEIALSEVRVPGENERGDSGVANLANLRHDLVGVPDDGDARPAARPTDASPEVSFDVAVDIGRLTKFALSCDAD